MDIPITMDHPFCTKRHSCRKEKLVYHMDRAYYCVFMMGYDIGSSKGALAEQTCCFRKVFEQSLKLGTLEGKSVKRNILKTMGLFQRITAAKALTGTDLAGLSRRPMLDDATSRHIGTILAQYTDCNQEGECNMYVINYEGATRTKWKPNVSQ